MSGRRLGLYVHWPYCARICPYCDFNVFRARGVDPEPMLAAIVADMARWRQDTGPRPLASLFLGGGTPSLLEPRDIARLIEAADRLWGFEAGAEITLEANPTDAETARFAGYAQAGVERLSLGVQALDDAALTALGRDHDSAAARRAAGLARDLFPRLSIDLIYARPGQTLQAWERELGEAIALGPDHLSPYQLTIEPGTAFERAARRGRLATPPPDLAADFLALTRGLAAAHGLPAYEVSNHARDPASQSRHNLIYWTSQDWVGVGPGAHGRLGAGAARRAARAVPAPGAYLAGAAEEDALLAPDEARAEYWLMGLRIAQGVRMDEAPGHPLDPAALSDAQAEGLAWQAGGRVGLTEAGIAVADSLAARLILA